MMPPKVVPTVAWLVLSCLMVQSQVKGEDLQEEQLSPRIRCPKGSMAYGSYCYALFKTELTWMDADMACQKRPKGHLVSVLTASEGYFVASLLRNSGTKSSHIWIGLHDPTEGTEPNAGGWEWIVGDVLNYKAWDSGYPSNSGYCGAVSSSSGYEKWQTYNCRRPLPYICKFEA